jgi:hypothetical protein
LVALSVVIARTLLLNPNCLIVFVKKRARATPEGNLQSIQSQQSS